MSTLVELQEDVYPFGCKGDVVSLEDKQLKDLDTELTKRKIRNGYNKIDQAVESGDQPVSDKKSEKKDDVKKSDEPTK